MGTLSLVRRSPGASDRLPLLGSARTPWESMALIAVGVAVACLPFLVPSGPLDAAPVDPLIAVAVALTLLWAGTDAVALRWPYALPLGLIVIGGSLGALMGPVASSGLVALIQDLVLWMWAAALVNLARRPENLRALLAVWCYAAVVWTVLLYVALVAHIPAISGVTAREGSRISLVLGDPNFAGNYFFVSIMMVAASGFPRHRVARVLTYLGLAGALVLTGSNSAVTSLVLGIVILTVVGVYRRSGLVPATCTLATMVVVGGLLVTLVPVASLRMAAANSSHPAIRDGVGRSASSVESRDLLFHESLGLFYGGNLLGTGPTSTKPRLIADQSLYPKEAHSDYWAALVERGVIGFLGLVLLVGSILTYSWFVLSRPRAPAFVWAVPRPEGLVAAAAACLLAGTVYEILHLRHVWFVFAMVAALAIWGRDDA
jgi:O-Antigen ligase